jgi:hypothetical protein
VYLLRNLNEPDSSSVLVHNGANRKGSAKAEPFSLVSTVLPANEE